MAILLDTDFLVSTFIDVESTHSSALRLHSQFGKDSLVIINLVVFELATVLSRKLQHREAVRLINELCNRDIQFLNALDYESDIWDEFRSYSKKNISFVDCANLVVAQKLKAKIASFDTFYPRTILVTAK